MSDWESICEDARHDEELILEKNKIIEPYNYEYAKRLSKKAKINEQPPLVQKYWLGRLAYELASRNEKVKAIKEKCNALSDKKEYPEEFSPRDRCLILSLDSYGFTAQPEDNLLKTEHTSFPARLMHHTYGFIEVNTIFKIERLLRILDATTTVKKEKMNNNTYPKWLNIGKAYIDSYLELIQIIEYEEDGTSNKYIPLKKKHPFIL